MPESLAAKLLASKQVAGGDTVGDEIALRMDQALLQDVLGTLVMLELEAMAVDRIETSPSVQYIDHGIVQSDPLDAGTHLFLKSACARFGVHYSGPGNGISHPVHMEHFGIPGESLIGCDSHTPAAGALGMLALGAGGIDVALAMAGEPFCLPRPSIWRIELSGTLPDWVSAKDVVLTLLQRHGTDGATNCILEYAGEGLACLSAMDRHVIANMGTEMGASTSVFPSDEATRRFLASRGRAEDWRPLGADEGADYDHHETLALDTLEPMIARPSSPGNVVAVREIAGEPVFQSYIGSSANPGYRDFAVASEMLRGRQAVPGVSLDINPSSRQVLNTLIREGRLQPLIEGGARLHQAGCNGCIGMGQAPAAGRNSLRTVARNFPGRSGTPEDAVFLCSPESAAAAALHGEITDPRELDMAYPRIEEPERMPLSRVGFLHHDPPDPASRPELEITDNTPRLPTLEALPDELELDVVLALEDDVSTDDIIPAGHALRYWSNVFATRRFAFERLAPDYRERVADGRPHAIVAGRNYGQGSSRENAALVPRIMGLRVVVAESFARIHWQNLASFGVLALRFGNVEDRERLLASGVLRIANVAEQLRGGREVQATIAGDDSPLRLVHALSERQIDAVVAGGVINRVRERVAS